MQKNHEKGLTMKLLYEDEIFQVGTLEEIISNIDNKIIQEEIKRIIDEVNVKKVEYHKSDNLNEKMSILKSVSYTISNYLRDFEIFSENISSLEKTLWRQSVEIHDSIVNQISVDLNRELYKNERYIHQRLEISSSLKRDIGDSTAKLTSSFLRTASSLTKKKTDNNISTSIENYVEKYFSEKHIKMILKKTLELSLTKFTNEWQDTIDKAIIESNFDRYNLPQHAFDRNEFSEEISSSEQALITGFGAAVIGTVGLAAGWHTLTYSLLNVFPPLLIFSVILYPLINMMGKEKSIQKKKDTITKLKNNTFDNLNRIIVGPSNDKVTSVSEYIKSMNKKIIEETLVRSKKMNFYDISLTTIESIRRGLNDYIEKINHSLVSGDIIKKLELNSKSDTIHLENQEIRSVLTKSFIEAETEIDIISPWLSFNVVNYQFRMLMESAIKRGVRIRIIYGIGSNSDLNNHRSSHSDQVAKKLEDYFSKYRNLFKIERSNTHYKLLICDEKYYVVGSYNFLSFSGKYVTDVRREGADLSSNLQMIREKREHYFGHLK